MSWCDTGESNIVAENEKSLGQASNSILSYPERQVFIALLNATKTQRRTIEAGTRGFGK